MVEQLKVSVGESETEIQTTADGCGYQSTKRIHTREGKPFCLVHIMLDNALFQRVPKKFTQEIVVSVLNDLGVTIANARQKNNNFICWLCTSTKS